MSAVGKKGKDAIRENFIAFRALGTDNSGIFGCWSKSGNPYRERGDEGGGLGHRFLPDRRCLPMSRNVLGGYDEGEMDDHFPLDIF